MCHPIPREFTVLLDAGKCNDDARTLTVISKSVTKFIGIIFSGLVTANSMNLNIVSWKWKLVWTCWKHSKWNHNVVKHGTLMQFAKKIKTFFYWVSVDMHHFTTEIPHLKKHKTVPQYKRVGVISQHFLCSDNTTYMWQLQWHYYN